MDWAPYADAGLLDVADEALDDRKALLAWLAGEGYGIDDMIAAHQRGRLFGLAGDRLAVPGGRTLSLAEVAVAVGQDEAAVRRLWRALGFTPGAPDELVAAPMDAEALQVMFLVSSIVGEAEMLELARAVGAGLASIGDTINAFGRGLSFSGALETSTGELETGQYWASIAPLVPLAAGLLDAGFRHHFEIARQHFERLASFDLLLRKRARLSVAFIDMSGFTSAAEELDDDAFESLVRSFESDVVETVQDLGGRVVKFVGDAAMIVAPNAVAIATIARELVARRSEVPNLELHIGLAHGEVLTRLGDYFGRPVNLASRLSAVADARTILTTAECGEELTQAGWQVEAMPAAEIRGIAQPVATCRVAL